MACCIMGKYCLKVFVVTQPPNCLSAIISRLQSLFSLLFTNLLRPLELFYISTFELLIGYNLALTSYISNIFYIKVDWDPCDVKQDDIYINSILKHCYGWATANVVLEVQVLNLSFRTCYQVKIQYLIT